jgi:8-oxo-dGTP pyrophosphatase MutT (NUDIX family)
MTLSRVAAIYLLRDDGAALLQHRDDKPEIPHPNVWVPPGGHCEDGESIEACARREFFEETDYRLAGLRQIADVVDAHAVGFPPLQLAVFWGRYDGVQPVVCREGQALAFIPRDRAVALGVPPYLIELWDAALRDAASLDGTPR